MKSLTKTIVLLLFILFTSSVVEAQIKGLLRDKAIEAVANKKAEEDKKKEQALKQEQKEQNQTQPNKPSKAPNALERKMMQAIGLNNVKYDLQYNFTSSMVMDIETIDSLKKKEMVQYTTLFNPDDKNFALQFEGVDSETGNKKKTLMIFDMKNNAMLILGEENGERSGMAMSIEPDATEITNEDTDESDEINDYPEEFVHPFYTATGRTKTIAGYGCKEYSYKNEEGSVNLWITNDSKLNLSKAYGHMQGFQALSTGGWAFGMGTAMEMMWLDNRSGAQSKMMVKDIQPNSPKRLDVTGYQIIGIGGGK